MGCWARVIFYIRPCKVAARLIRFLSAKQYRNWLKKKETPYAVQISILSKSNHIYIYCVRKV